MNGAEDLEIQLHVWERNEIENYILVPAAISRAIAIQARDASNIPDEGTVSAELDHIARNLRTETMDAIATEMLARDKAAGLGPANRAARERIAKAWKSADGRLSIVSGKEVLKRIFAWAQKEF